MSETTIKIGNRIGFFGLWLFCFSSFLSTAGAGAGYVIFTVAMLFSDNRWRQWAGDPLILACAGFSIFIGIRTFFAVQILPDNSVDMWSKLVSWEKLLLFIPFGYWMFRRSEWRPGLLLASVCGLVIGMLLKVDWVNITGFLGSRTGFQFPMLGFAYVSGIAILGLSLLGVAPSNSGGKLFQKFWFSIIVLLLLILIQGFIQSYSRAAWLAMLAALLVMVACWYWGPGRAHPEVSPRSLAYVGILLLAGILMIVMLNQEKILQRVAFESDVYGQILNNDRDDTEFSSTGLRLNAWAFGLGKLAERPLLGWGPGATGYLVEQSGLPEKLSTPDGEWLKHLHNTFIDVLVQFGLVGFIWVLLILALLGRVVVKAAEAGRMPRRYTLFFISVFVFAFVCSIFNYRIVHRDWLFSWILLAGTLFSFHLQMILDKADVVPRRDVPE